MRARTVGLIMVQNIGPKFRFHLGGDICQLLSCHTSTCLRIGSRSLCIRSLPIEIQSTSENDLECFASTGLNTRGTMFLYSGPVKCWISQKPTCATRNVDEIELHCLLVRRLASRQPRPVASLAVVN